MNKYYSYFSHLTVIFALLFVIGVESTLGDTYTLITSNSSLSNDDIVILATKSNNAPATGVTGQSGSTATVSTTASQWVQYTVKNAGSSGWQLKIGNQYIASPGSAEFKYGNSGGTCSVNSNGVLFCNSRFLGQNGSNYKFYASSNLSSYTPFYVWKVTTGSGGGGSSNCNAVDVTGGSTVIIPAGSATYSGGDWEDAGAPTAYPSSTTEYKIGSGDYCVTLTKAADYSKNANGLQLQGSNGIVKIEGITSTAGVDVEVVIGSGSGFSIALTGATNTPLTGKGAGTHTISTTSTSATLTISNATSGAGYLKTIKISPKCAAPTGLTKGSFFWTSCF